MGKLNQSIKHKKRRRRITLVCYSCRKRKIKCDRKHPCSNCINFKISDSCFYDPHIDEESKFRSKIEVKLPWTKQSTSSSSFCETNKSFVGVFPLDEGILESSDEISNFANTSVEASCIAADDVNGSDCNSMISESKSGKEAIKSHSNSEKLKLEFKQQLKVSSRNINCAHRRENNYCPTSSSLNRHITKQSVFDSDNTCVSFSKVSSDNISHLFPANPSNSVSNEYSKKKSMNKVQSEGTIGLSTDSISLDVMRDNSMGVNSQISYNGCSETFLLGVNIVADFEDTINFYENYSSIHSKDPFRRVNFGPFAWTSLMNRDNGLHMVWNHIIKQKTEIFSKERSAALVFAQQTNELTKENTDAIISIEKCDGDLERKFQKRSLELDGYEELVLYENILTRRQKSISSTRSHDIQNLDVNSSFYDIQIDRELQLIKVIETILPKKRVIWKLIDRYFQCVYIYMPYLDEEYFRRDVSSIIGAQSYENIPANIIKVEKKLDLAVVGILLIVLRFGYLSLYSNVGSSNTIISNTKDISDEPQDIQYLMDHPIDMKIADMAQLCLDQFQLMRRPNFLILQLTLYLRLYHTFSPEDGDGADGGDSHGSKAVLIQMAYSLGLNREPDERCTDLKINNLSRKIWNYLVLSDLYMAYSFGSPMTIDTIYSDVRAPLYVKGGENIVDINIDVSLNKCHNNCKFLFPKLRSLLRSALNVQSRVSLPIMCESLSKIELEWYIHCGTLKDCMTYNGIDYTRIIEANLKTKLYLAFKTFLLSVYFHIFIYYEPKKVDISFFYLKKCLIITASDFMPQYEILFHKCTIINAFLINPTLQAAVQKANIIYLSFLLRTNFVIFHMRQSLDHNRFCTDDPEYLCYFQKLCQLSNCLIRSLEYSIYCVTRISGRYYFAWRISKGQKFILNTITSKRFYEQNYHRLLSLYPAKYSQEQLEDLVQICESTLSDIYDGDSHNFGFTEKAEQEIYHNGTSSSKMTNNMETTDLDVDKLWWKILSTKHEKSVFRNDQSYASNEETATQKSQNSNIISSDNSQDIYPSYTLNINKKPVEATEFSLDEEILKRFDLFSDWPLG